ncbi:MAG TPA: molybdopterin cofactor-binding domain-containing protein [Vicinamibacterales bacterium]|nr:molybdopterin cofactor-binding domain-containing protein [Vicinamibacterales bacterium]
MTVARRAFLKQSGALIVYYGAASAIALPEREASAERAQGPFDTRNSHVDPRQLDSWVSVNGDGTVTARTGKCELGQGVLTAQLQLIAEELAIPIGRVHLVQCDTDVCPDQGTTSGSQSTPTNFNERGLAQACATAREALVALASTRLGVPVQELQAGDGAVVSRTNRLKRATYAQLVGGKTFNLPLNAEAKRKPAGEWTVLGKPIPRVDMAAMATATFEYGHNVKVPGMLHGAVVRPPEVGAHVVSVDESPVAAMAGVVKVVVRKDFVGVVAAKPFQAVQAAKALKVNWSRGAGLPKRDTFDAHMRTQPSRDAFLVDTRDVDPALARAAAVVKATYTHPYQMHASMGTSCAVADVRADGVTVWSPTQSAYPTRSCVATLLGVPLEKVRVIFTRGAGCYGINGADTVSFDAAVLSQAVGKPVRVQLSRRDEMAWENYGFAYAIDQRAGVASDGTIVAWDYESWSPSLGGRPGYDQPGNVVTGMLLGHAPSAVAPRAAGAAPGQLRNNSNAAPSYIAAATGSIASARVLNHTVASPFFTGPLRSPSRLQNTFAHECFIDELAARAKADPIEYRLRHLRDPRLIDVVKAVAKAANWQPRPSPAQGTSGRGRGLSCVLYEGDNGYVAMVAEVAVDRATGAVTATRLFLAQDCGPISNPDGMRNQLEGGALQGLSRCLGEEVTWDDHAVTSIDWRTYHSATLGLHVPVIESVLINRPEKPADGAGETAITIVAAAVGNAIFDATGGRIRQVPFTRERVKAALASSTTMADAAPVMAPATTSRG